VTAHEAQIFPAHIYGFGTFRACCACGWIGDDAFTEADARQQHHRHSLKAALRPRWILTDGGRKAAGYRGTTGDCVIRALTLAVYPEVVADPTTETAGTRYKTMYRALQERQRQWTGKATLGRDSVRNGVYTFVYREMLNDAKWRHTQINTMVPRPKIHLKREELPGGRLLVELNRHLVAVIDGTIYDQFDSSRDGARIVNGYWEAPNA
jgi:hypothetical protein